MFSLNILPKLTAQPLHGLKRTVIMAVFDAFLASVPFAFLYQIILNMLSTTPDMTFQFMMVGGCAVFMILRIFIARYIYISINLIGFDAGRKIRRRLGDHLRKMPMGFFQETDFGSVNNTLLKDIDLIERIFTHIYAPLIATISILIFFAIGLSITNWRLGMAMMSTLPFAVMAYLLTRQYARKWQDRMQRLIHGLNDAIIEYMDGLKILKSHRMTGQAFTKLDDLLKKTRQQALNAEKAAVLPVYSFNLLVESGFIILLLVMTWSWTGGTLSIPQMILFLIASLRFFKPLLSLSMFLAELNYMDLAARRVDKILHLPTLPQGTSQPELKDISVSFENISFGYSKTVLFSGLNLTIPQNKVTALVGPSGAGKSTIASLVARFWEPQKGRILVGTGKDRLDISTMELEYWLHHISIVFQTSYIFNDTITNNLKVAKPDATDTELKNVCNQAQLGSLIADLPLGMDTEVGAGGIHLSGGEMQRLAIARSLLKDAPFIILDEATASLDPENERDIQLAMQNLIQNKTVLVIAHKLTTICHADQIIVLEQGNIAEQGNHEQLMAKKGLYHELWSLQESSKSWSIK